MNILVTGGAGYIGSVLTEELLNQGHSAIVLDNLSRGHREAVAPGATFIQTDLNNTEALEDIFQHNHIDAVMHLAAFTSVEQSMAEPGKYFSNNVTYGINLLECMLKHKVKRFVFSSTAAVYGEPEVVPITEDSPMNPVNAYIMAIFGVSGMLNLRYSLKRENRGSWKPRCLRIINSAIRLKNTPITMKAAITPFSS